MTSGSVESQVFCEAFHATIQMKFVNLILMRVTLLDALGHLGHQPGLRNHMIGYDRELICLLHGLA